MVTAAVKVCATEIVVTDMCESGGRGLVVGGRRAIRRHASPTYQSAKLIDEGI
jgi:hypothetical protein